MNPASLRANALLLLSAGWLTGVSCAAIYSDVWWPGAAAIAVGTLTAFLLRRNLWLMALGVLTTALFLGGAHLYVDRLPSSEPKGISVHNDVVPVRFRALVTDEPDVEGRSQRVRLDVREVFLNDRWREESGGVLLRTGQFPRYHYGNVLEVTAELETPPTFPDFDYREYLAMRGVQSIAAYGEVAIVARDQGNVARAALYDVRSKLGDGLQRVLPEPQASLAEGIFVGQRASIPDELNVAMNSTGTSHLVAVSGENVAIVAALTISALAWLIGRRQAALIALVTIGGYVLLTGASPSVVRAGIMGSLFVVATLAGRPASAGTSVALAAAIMAGIDPLVVHDISFQLSFAAILGLVYLAPAFESFGGEIARRAGIEPVESPSASFLIENLAVTLAAIAATEPLIALHFGRISIIAPLANLPLVPAFPIILASSGVTAVATLIWEPLGEVTTWLTWPLLTYMIEAVRFFAGLPAASIRIEHFGKLHAAVVYGALAAFALATRRRSLRDVKELRVSAAASRHSLRPVWLLAGGLTVAAVLAWVAAFDSGGGRLTVSVLDVGQGDAILIETPDGRHALVDGGASGLVLAQRLGEELPFWERTLDLVALTHPQEDHMGGLIDALERYDVRQVIASPYEADGAGYEEWRERIDEREIAYRETNAGDVIALGDGITLRVLAPDRDLLALDEANNESLVLKLTWRDVSFLLTGDIEVEAEEELVQSGADLRATVLKVPHHGSATSSSTAFVQAVQPALSVVSVGASNPFGHPVASVMERLEEASVVLRTDEHGTIEMSTNGRKVWVDTQR